MGGIDSSSASVFEAEVMSGPPERLRSFVARNILQIKVSQKIFFISKQHLLAFQRYGLAIAHSVPHTHAQTSNQCWVKSKNGCVGGKLVADSFPLLAFR